MSSRHKAVTPQAQKARYDPGEHVDLLATFEQLALSKGSCYVSGQVAFLNESGGDVGVNDQVYYNHRVGAHGFFDNINTSFAGRTVEQLDYYPSYVSNTTLGSELPLERGTTTPSAMELRVPTAENARAICETGTASNPVSFCIQLRCAINKFNQPVNYETSGEVLIRMRINDSIRALYATDGSRPSFYLTNLELRYEVQPPSPYSGPLETEVINSFLQTLESTQQNISMLIPTGKTDSIIARFIRQDHDQTDTTYDKLACEVVPGLAPGNQNVPSDRYGFHGIIYSVNDLDSSPVNFQLTSREEIIVNYLRALRKDWQYKYSYQLDNLINGGVADSYAIGVNFGGPVDFSKQSFTATLRSAITQTYNGYFHSRSVVALT